MADLTIYLLTFNCARNLIQPVTFSQHVFDTLPQESVLPDILVISLQEIAPIAYSFLGGSFLAPYFDAFRRAVRLVAKDYTHIITRNVGMTAMMIFAKDPARISSSVETAGVGVGFQEMGNKGAVGVRLTVEETQFTFVGAHLAPNEAGMVRRNEDWKNIVRGLVFASEDEVVKDDHGEIVPLLHGSNSSRGSPSGLYAPMSNLFVAGDLNYRASQVKPGPKDAEKFPQPTDEPDNARHYSKLLKSDQLSQQLQQGNTLHGFTEPKVQFPPTYKLFASQNDNVWNWAPRRWPSWCDRILYRQGVEGQMRINKYDVLLQQNTSDHRPVVLSLSVSSKPSRESAAGEDDSRDIQAPFPIDPDWQSRRALARKKEIAVGIICYLILTWEGNGLLLATVIGGLGGWLIVTSLLAV